MPYIKQRADWQSGVAGGTPITEANLDGIEAGIETAQSIAEAALAVNTAHFVESMLCDPANNNAEVIVLTPVDIDGVSIGPEVYYNNDFGHTEFTGDETTLVPCPVPESLPRVTTLPSASGSLASMPVVMLDDGTKDLTEFRTNGVIWTTESATELPPTPTYVLDAAGGTVDSVLVSTFAEDLTAKVRNVNGGLTKFFLSTKIDDGSIVWLETEGLAATPSVAYESSIEYEDWWVRRNSIAYWSLETLEIGSVSWIATKGGLVIGIPPGSSMTSEGLVITGISGSQPFLPLILPGNTDAGDAVTVAMRLRVDAVSANRILSTETIANDNINFHVRSGTDDLNLAVKDPAGSIVSTNPPNLPQAAVGDWRITAFAYDDAGTEQWGNDGTNRSLARTDVDNITSIHQPRLGQVPYIEGAGTAMTISHLAVFHSRLTSADFTIIEGAFS